MSIPPPTLIEFWNFNPTMYPNLKNFKSDVLDHHKNVPVHEIGPEQLRKGSYSQQDKVIIAFTEDDNLNRLAQEALRNHNKNKTQVIMYPKRINAGAIPCQPASVKTDIINALYNYFGEPKSHNNAHGSSGPSVLDAHSKLPTDQRQNASPIGFYVFKSKNQEFNFKMNQVFYKYHGNTSVEFDEIRRLSLMSQRPNKKQLLVVCSTDMEAASYDLSSVRNSDSGKMVAILFNMGQDMNVPNDYDYIAQDTQIIEEQLELMLHALPKPGKSKLVSMQDANRSAISNRNLTSKIGLTQPSIMLQSTVPGPRLSTRKLTPTGSILLNEPKVYMMNTPSIVQTANVIPNNFQIIDNFNQFSPIGTKNYVIVPANLAPEVLAKIPPQDFNKIAIIIYGTSPPVSHPTIELTSNDMAYIKNYLASKGIRQINQQAVVSRNSFIATSPMERSTRSLERSSTMVNNLGVTGRRVNLIPPQNMRYSFGGPSPYYETGTYSQPVGSNHMLNVPNSAIPQTVIPPTINGGNVTTLHSLATNNNILRTQSADTNRISAYYNNHRPLLGIDQKARNNEDRQVSHTTIQENENGSVQKTTTREKKGKRVIEETTTTTTTFEPMTVQVPVVTKIVNQITTPLIPSREDLNKSTTKVEINIPRNEPRIEVIQPTKTTTVKMRESQSSTEHNNLAIDSTLGFKRIETREVKPTIMIPEVEEMDLSIRKSILNKSKSSNRVVREEIRVHPPDHTAAIVQEIRQTNGNELLLPGRVSTTLVGSRLNDSTLNILNNSRMRGSRTNVHYRLETPTAPVTTYIKEYTEVSNDPVTTYVRQYAQNSIIPSQIERSIIKAEIAQKKRAESPFIEVTRSLQPTTIRQVTNISTEQRRGEARVLSQSKDLSGYLKRIQNGIQVYYKPADNVNRSMSEGKHIQMTYSTQEEITPRKYISPIVKDDRILTPLSGSRTITAVTTGERVVEERYRELNSGTRLLEDAAALIDKRNTVTNPRDLTTIDGQYFSDLGYRTVTEPSYNQVHTTVVETVPVPGRSIYFTGTNHKEYVVAPHSGRVRQLSQSQKNIRKRSGSAKRSYVGSPGGSVLYMVPQARKNLADELYKYIQPSDKVQLYDFNEDLKYVRYSEFSLVLIFPADESKTTLPGDYERPNSYIVKMSRPAIGNKEIRIDRLQDIVTVGSNLISMRLGQQHVRPKTHGDTSIIYKKHNRVLENAIGRLGHNYKTYPFYSDQQLESVSRQISRSNNVVMLVDEVPQRIDLFQNFSLFSCIVVPQDNQFRRQKEKYAKFRWVHDSDPEHIAEEVRHEVHKLSKKSEVFRNTVKSNLPRVISYYTDVGVHQLIDNRFKGQVHSVKYNDLSSLTKRIEEAGTNKKFIVMNPEFAGFAGMVEQLVRDSGVIAIYDQSGKSAWSSNARIVKSIDELSDELNAYLHYIG